MTWTKNFSGTRHEIIAAVNTDGALPEEAHPLHAIRQFIGGQLSTIEQDPIAMREYAVIVSGGTSSSDGHQSANLFVSVTRGEVRQEPVKQEEPADVA